MNDKHYTYTQFEIFSYAIFEYGTMQIFFKRFKHLIRVEHGHLDLNEIIQTQNKR